MNDETDIRLVYAHTESIRTHHHTYVILLPALLPVRTRILPESGMIERRRYAVGSKKGRQLLCPPAAAHINDSRPRDIGAYIQQLAKLILALTHDIRKIRPLESALYQTLLLESEPLHYIVGDSRSRSRRQRYDRSVDNLAKLAYAEIVRTEIVSPL